MSAEINTPNEDSEELVKLAAAFTEQWPFLDVQLDLVDFGPAIAVKFAPVFGDMHRVVRFAVRGARNAGEFEESFRGWARAKLAEAPASGDVNGRGYLAGPANERLQYIKETLADWAAHNPVKRDWLGLS